MEKNPLLIIYLILDSYINRLVKGILEDNKQEPVPQTLFYIVLLLHKISHCWFLSFTVQWHVD